MLTVMSSILAAIDGVLWCTVSYFGKDKMENKYLLSILL